MNKLRVIDLLNKIANGEEIPKKIKYNNETFTIREEKDDYANQNHWFTDRVCLLDLNKEVEIIEEDKKIEKITDEAFLSSLFGQMLGNKINEIIDKLNSMEK